MEEVRGQGKLTIQCWHYGVHMDVPRCDLQTGIPESEAGTCMPCGLEMAAGEAQLCPHVHCDFSLSVCE